MEGQEYLNQISASNKSATKTKNSFLSSKIFLVSIIGIILFVIIIIVGSLLGGGKNNEINLSYGLKLHLNNTSSVIQTYQPSVKSSVLRSSSASLYSILVNTDRDLSNYLSSLSDFNEKNIDKKIASQATLEKDDLEAELFEAKINGILDRIYAHKMAYEISILMNEEAKIINLSKNSALQELLKISYNSLQNLLTNFSDYSETK